MPKYDDVPTDDQLTGSRRRTVATPPAAPMPYPVASHDAPPEPAYAAQPDLLALMPAHLRRGAEMAGRAYLSARQKAAARWVDWAHAVAALRAGGVPEEAIALLAAQAGVQLPEPPAAGANGQASG
jgi:hypothetical protein